MEKEIHIEKQYKGGSHDSSESIYFDVEKECDLFFEKLKLVFFNINVWDGLFGKGTNFQVTNPNGTEKEGEIKVKDLVKLQIPGPKSKIGGNYDWVEISKLESAKAGNEFSFCIVLSPCAKYNIPKTTAHFFGPDAKNYFIVRKSPLKITAEVHGRNEVPNYINLGIWDTVRNFCVANGGFLGMSKIHWETWCKNILSNETLDKCIKNI